MKKNLQYSVVVLAGALQLGAVPVPAALTVVAGDLVMGFARVNAGGTGYEGNTYVYNLGPSTNYREAGSVPIVIDNLNSDLSVAFGPGWVNDARVRWGVVGVVGPTDPLTAGDPARTTYLSQDYLGGAAGSAAFDLSSSQRGTLSTNLRSFYTSMNGAAENGAVDGGALYPASGLNSFSSFLPPGPPTYFGIGTNPLTSLTASSQAGLDVYRTLHTATGAELNSSFDSDAVVGAGQYVGTFLLSDSGAVTFVPEPTAGLLAILGCLQLLRRRRA